MFHRLMRSCKKLANASDLECVVAVHFAQDRRHRARMWGWFWRESLGDGVYAIGGALVRPSNGSRARYIGSQANFELRWALDLHTTIAINLAGFFTGGFLKHTGPAGNVAFSNLGDLQVLNCLAIEGPYVR